MTPNDYVIISLDKQGNAWLWQDQTLRWIRNVENCSHFASFQDASKCSRTLSGWGVIEIVTVGTYHKLYGKESGNTR